MNMTTQVYDEVAAARELSVDELSSMSVEKLTQLYGSLQNNLDLTTQVGGPLPVAGEVRGLAYTIVNHQEHTALRYAIVGMTAFIYQMLEEYDASPEDKAVVRRFVDHYFDFDPIRHVQPTDLEQRLPAYDTIMAIETFIKARIEDVKKVTHQIWTTLPIRNMIGLWEYFKARDDADLHAQFKAHCQKYESSFRLPIDLVKFGCWNVVGMSTFEPEAKQMLCTDVNLNKILEQRSEDKKIVEQMLKRRIKIMKAKTLFGATDLEELVHIDKIDSGVSKILTKLDSQILYKCQGNTVKDFAVHFVQEIVEYLSARTKDPQIVEALATAVKASFVGTIEAKDIQAALDTLIEFIQKHFQDDDTAKLILNELCEIDLANINQDVKKRMFAVATELERCKAALTATADPHEQDTLNNTIKKLEKELVDTHAANCAPDDASQVEVIHLNDDKVTKSNIFIK